MKYQTQKVAMLYFYGALGLFLAQVLFGVLAGTIYVLPNTLSELLPFNIVRMIHTNALVVWLLMGLHTAHLLIDTVDTLVLAVLMHTGPLEGKRFADVSENAVYWYFVVLSWLPIYFVIYWAPRLSG